MSIEGRRLENPQLEEGYKGEKPSHEFANELRELKALFGDNTPSNLAQLKALFKADDKFIDKSPVDDQKFEFKLAVGELPGDEFKRSLGIEGTALNKGGKNNLEAATIESLRGVFSATYKPKKISLEDGEVMQQRKTKDYFDLIEDKALWQRVTVFTDNEASRKPSTTEIIDRLALNKSYFHRFQEEGDLNSEKKFEESWRNRYGKILTISNRFITPEDKPIELSFEIVKKLMAQNIESDIYEVGMKVVTNIDTGEELDQKSLAMFLNDALSWIEEEKVKGGLAVEHA